MLTCDLRCDLRYSTAALAVCLGSMPSWKMILHPSLVASNRFSYRIALFSSTHLPINSDQHPCHCFKEALPQHDAAITMFHNGNGVFRLMCSVYFQPYIAFCM
ncbi:hypothetical protein ATANTOWER_008977 [Ataeniobius toweri]|uniref:Uncharacterized protein n=1 Tax=Ataeniobius toweri TaxID=208326 RepID=A0ABU7AVB0_9TELE|nr:hypothetical protein [Ataeniobius toweri]